MAEQTKTTTSQDRGTLRATVSPSEYKDVFTRAMRNELQQPWSADAGLGPRIASGVATLADLFIDSYYEQFKQLPDKDELAGYMKRTLTAPVAAQFLTGMTPESIKASYVTPEIKALAVAKQKFGGGEDSGERTIADMLNALAQEQIAYGTKELEETYGQQRGRAISEERALGRISMPVSASRYSPIARIDEQRQKSISNLISQIRQGNLGATAGYVEQERARSLDTALRQQELAENRRLAELGWNRENALRQQEMSLAERLGKLQANANKKGWTDYLGLGLAGLGAVTGGLGALGSGYAAYRESKK